MTLELTRVDYTLLGLTSPQCMKLLPGAGSKGMQKVVVGDHEGIVQLFSLKKGEIQVAFKTLPGEKITRIQLGGALGTIQDKIFCSSKNEVRGYTKKGKLFLGFETSLTELIKSMHVSGSDLLVAGDHVYNHYKDCKDANAFLCGDKINDLISLNVEKYHQLVPILACQDRSLQVLDQSSVCQTVTLDSSPLTLHLYHNNGGDLGDHILYGTEDGTIGLLQISKSSCTTKWIIQSEKHKGGVLSMHCYDMTGDGIPDLLIGRQDGLLEVYSMPTDIGEDNQPPLERFSYSCNESVTSVQGGVVGNTGFDEVLATTYTGWFFGLTTGVIEKQVSGDGGDLNSKIRLSNDDKMKIIKLRAEVEELEQKVMKECEKYQSSTQEDSPGFSTIPFLSISDKMWLCKEDAVYMLSLEVQTAIDNVLLKSNVPLTLLDVEKNSAVVSHSTCDPLTDCKLLATYRCQMNTTRLEVRVRTNEGQHGTLIAYITPLIQPKCCQLRHYPIKLLSLHTRCHEFDPSRSYNVLTLKGAFSLAEMHAWVSFCLPEVPEKTPVSQHAEFTFISTFLGTMLNCSYGKGEAEFKSDNISTISILKDVLTKEATKKKIKLDISCNINDDSMISVINLLHPKIEFYVNLLKQVTLLEALNDVETHDNNMSGCLSAEYKQILHNQHEILAQYNKYPGYLDRLKCAVVDLYVDWFKFKGINVKPKIPLLTDALNNYSLDLILSFFNNKVM
ncbi:BBSome complex member BBS7-like [Lycorma delicatula]|uniref:BBSome complex member BBS7-like n=1 Tax=Lycorma delicatula TaxID=130591 RepID=UPI003F51ABF2